MTIHKNSGDEKSRDEDSVAKLMSLAGPRAAIPADVQARVYANVREEWLAGTAVKRTARWAIPLAIAASAVLAVTLVIQPAETPLVRVGTVARLDPGSQAAGAHLAPGDGVHAGDTLATSDGQGMSVLLRGGASLRLDEDTVLQVDGQDDFTLIQGRIYADSGQSVYRDGTLNIDTPYGSVTDIGTQFSVAFDDTELAVAVREGRVDVAARLDTYVALAGNRMVLSKSGDVATIPVAANDDSWNWAVDLAPAYDIDNKTLLDFLKWVARETGRELVFADDDLRLAAMGTVLHGSVSDFTPIEATASVLATTTFRYRMDSTRLVIER